MESSRNHSNSSSGILSLMPSQAISGNRSHPITSSGDRRGRTPRNRGPRGREIRDGQDQQKVPEGEGAMVNEVDSSNPTALEAPKRRRRPRRKHVGSRTDTLAPSDVTTSLDVHARTPAVDLIPATESDQPSKSKKNKNNKNKVKAKQPKNPTNKKKLHQAWWKKHLPPDAVDPITLDPLDTLHYPPFCLAGTEPYEPMDWPTSLDKSNDDNMNNNSSSRTANNGKLSEKERQRKIIEEQWGGAALAEPTVTEQAAPAGTETPSTTNDASTKKQSGSMKNRHNNLFDGRALAYYMVSQLQFIDPLNRRDLTRDELVHLDRYLRRHGFTDLNVTEAYDVKGVTLSTAGSAANTAQGRATILQQEARLLLHALFGNHHLPAVAASATTNTTTNNNSNSNNLMQQYEAHEASQMQQPHSRRNRNNGVHRIIEEDDIGIYGYGSSGLVIIDDDINPGLRGSAPSFVPSSAAATLAGGLYSASHIARLYGGGHATSRVQEHEFPTLATTTTASQQQAEQDSLQQQQQLSKRNLPKAKTLSVIGKLVQKTSPDELQRQWDAREEALRKATLSNLTFGSNQEAWGAAASELPAFGDGVPSQISTTTTTAAAAPSEAQLERNRAFAEALGVKPATVRSKIYFGWRRPAEGTLEVDEFGNEWNATIYPESLLKQASEMRLDVLLRLEKKWTTFLADDTAASLPLNPMDRSLRALVHEYSDYWKLHTESFDPEPKRYVHCVKLRDTRAPYPFLSEAIHNWRPGRKVDYLSTLDHSSLQTAGQPTKSFRELPCGPARIPLSLKPRSAIVETASRPPGVSIGGAPSRSMVEFDDNSTSRFSALANGRERPKLELQKRTLPLELPPLVAPTQELFDIAEDLQRQRERAAAKARKEKQTEELKQRALEAAFNSDDEREGRSESDSEWEEHDAAYTESDDER